VCGFFGWSPDESIAKKVPEPYERNDTKSAQSRPWMNGYGNYGNKYIQ
jgi:hypothetical protein